MEEVLRAGGRNPSMGMTDDAKGGVPADNALTP
ncbi:hypothetical protein A2U01_0102311, partial [Trifolium medium]|nr:hypothetical protein [Trifolium medium]